LGGLRICLKTPPGTRDRIAPTKIPATLDILHAMASNRGPKSAIVALGYSGWAPGQLEHELAQNAWLTVPASAEVLFGMPAEKRLAAAMSLLGIDYATLSEQAGHA
jgi:putative transcriptional regulator